MKTRSQCENFGISPQNLNIGQKMNESDNQLAKIEKMQIPLNGDQNNSTYITNVKLNENNNKTKANGTNFINIFRKKIPKSSDENILAVVVKEHAIIVDYPDTPRETWSKRLDFLMSIIGFSVDIAGIWRLLVIFIFSYSNSFRLFFNYFQTALIYA